MYSPVYSIKTGWIVGKIDNHIAKPLDENEVQEACIRLNEAIHIPEKWERHKQTKKTIETEEFIDTYIHQKGYPPTYEEIMEHFGLKSKAAAYARVRHCREKMIQIERQKQLYKLLSK